MRMWKIIIFISMCIVLFIFLLIYINSRSKVIHNNFKNIIYKTINNDQNNGSSPSSPYGLFISDHNINKSQMNNIYISYCNSTVGSFCSIDFLNNGKIIKLNRSIIGNIGYAVWYWTPIKIGLYSGRWEIRATSELNGNTKTTTDKKYLWIN